MPEGSAAIQRDIKRLENCADGNLMKFNNKKSRVPHLGRNQVKHQYTLEVTGWKAALRILEGKLKVRCSMPLQQRQPTDPRLHWEELPADPSLLLSTRESLLQYYVLWWASQYERDTDT